MATKKRASVYMLRVIGGEATPGTWVSHGLYGTSFEASAADGTAWPTLRYAQDTKRWVRHRNKTRTEIVRFVEVPK